MQPSAGIPNFDDPLQNEEAVLDAMLVALGKGQLPQTAWQDLHNAAIRDDRVAELDAAYNKFAGSPRVKALPAPAMAEFFFRVAQFLGNDLGDEFGSRSFLDKAIAAFPGHVASFRRLEELLIEGREDAELAELYRLAAPHRPRPEQQELLRRAGRAFDKLDTFDEKSIEVYTQLLKLDPADEDARARLEARYARTNRHRDIAKLLEGALAPPAPASPPPPDEAVRLRARLLDLYTNLLHEPERTIPHIEALLIHDPAREDAHRVAEKLLSHKVLAARAASVLATAFEQLGNASEVHKLLQVELENTRGPKRKDVFKRLGDLRLGKLGDTAGAYEAYEGALAVDPSDDELRASYCGLAMTLGTALEAARTLSRVSNLVKETSTRARIAADMGELQRFAGDTKRARATFVSVLGSPSGDPIAILKSARALTGYFAQEKDLRGLADALERIGNLSPDAEEKQDANERLAVLASGPLGDDARAIAAWRRLVDSPLRARALDALGPLYEKSGDVSSLSWVLEEKSKDEPDPERARALLFDAARTKAPEEAVRAWERFVERFGEDHDVLAQQIPLFEALGRWDDLALALEADARLAAASNDDGARAEIFARLGGVHLAKTGDVEKGIEAYAQALMADPSCAPARAALENLLASGAHRLAAAEVLEPIYRLDRSAGGAESGAAERGILAILAVRADLGESPSDRLTALDEATRIAEASSPDQAVVLAGRGLAEALASHTALDPWLAALDRLGGLGVDATKRAAVLEGALGERAIDSRELCALATSSAEAHAAAGSVDAALGAFRRALAFDPSSRHVLARIDDLLREQGNATERVAMFRAALDTVGGDVARRRELLHTIASLERTDLGNVDGAVLAYKAALLHDPDDGSAYAALLELYEETQAWENLCDLLEAHLAQCDGDEQKETRARLAEAAAAHGQVERAATQAFELLADPSLADVWLDVVIRVAQTLQHVALMRAAIGRRVERLEDPAQRASWLTRLGDLLEASGATDDAIEQFKLAADAAAAMGDDATARDLHQRVMGLRPRDVESARLLVEIYGRVELLQLIPPLLTLLAEEASTPREKVTLLMEKSRIHKGMDDPGRATLAIAAAFEAAPADADVVEAFEEAVEVSHDQDLFARTIDRTTDASDDQALRGDLQLRKARVLEGSALHIGAAGRTYRHILGLEELDDARRQAALLAFEGMLARRPDRVDDVRWLFAWKCDRATDAERAAILLEWAEMEEHTLQAKEEALGLYRRAVTSDPFNEAARSGVARVALQTGDVETAVYHLVALRDQSQGDARVARDVEIATILLDRQGKADQALDRVAEILAHTPTHPAALELGERLLAIPSVGTRALVVMQQALEHTDDAGKKIRILSDLVARDVGAPPEVRWGWYRSLCDLLDANDLHEDAFQKRVQAARELPGQLELWDRLEAQARERGSPEEVAAAYEEALRRLTDKGLALELGQRATGFYEEWFEDDPRVVSILERVLALDPTDTWAFDRLKLLYDSSERWDDLFILYDRAIEVSEGIARLDLLEEVAQIAKDFANHSERAIDYLEQLLALRPGNARLSGALERLYEKHGRHRELVSLLTLNLPQLKGREAQESRAKIAGLWLDELADAAAALLVVEDLINHQPDAASVGVDLCALLEKVLEIAAPNAEVRESTAPGPIGGSRDSSSGISTKRQLVRQRAAVLLKERYSEPGREADLVRVLEVEIEGVKSVKERIRRHQQIASLYEGLGRQVEALEHVVALVLLEPEVAGHREKLYQQSEAAQRFDRFVDVLITAADDCNDEALKVELMLTAGRACAERLGDASRAIDLLFRVLQIAPLADEHLLATSRLLEPLLEQEGRHSERLDVLERLSILEGGPETRLDVLGRAARLAVMLGEYERAIWAWEGRLESYPHDQEAQDGLVQLFERTEKWPKLVKILNRRAETPAERTDVERREDRVAVARILSDRLGSVREAIDAWQRIEDTFGEAEDSTHALADLYRKSGSYSDLALLLERAASRATSAARRAAWYCELGDLQREHTHELGKAVESYAQALDAAPHDELTRAGLMSLLMHPTHKKAATAVLFRAFTRMDEWQRILELLEHRLDSAPDDAVKVAILHESAVLAETRAGDLDQAFALLRRAFLVAPDSGEIEVDLARLADLTGEWRALADARREVLDGWEERPTSPSFLSALRFRQAELLETRLEDGRAALGLYQRVAHDNPKDLAAMSRTIRVAGRVSRWDAAARALVDGAKAVGKVESQLIVALEDAAGSTGGWEALAGALTTCVHERAGELPTTVARDTEALVARWHRDRRRDLDAAEVSFARALAHDPMNAEILSELTQLQRRVRGRPLIESLLRLSQATGGDLELLAEAAEIAITAQIDRALAKSILDRLLRLATERWLGEGEPITAGSPRNPQEYAAHALDDLVRVYKDDGDLERVAELLVENAHLPFSRETTRSMRLEAAELKRVHLGDPEGAAALYAGLIEADPHDMQAVLALVLLYEGTGKTGELLALKRRLLAVARTRDERTALRLEIARLEEALGQTDAAIFALRESLAEHADHPETVALLSSFLVRSAHPSELERLYADQARLAEVTNAAQAVEFWQLAAEVAEQKLHDPKLAKAHWEAFVRVEERPSALDALSRLSISLGQLADASAYLDRLRELSSGADRSRIALRLADILMKANQPEAARARLEEELAEDPQSEVVRQRLIDMYRGDADWRPLAGLLTNGADHAPDDATRLARLREAADLYRRRCDAPEMAVPLLERAAEIDPEDRLTRLALADALGAANRVEEARAILRRLIDGFAGRRPKERAPVHYHLAMLDLKLGDRAQAMSELDAATRIDPGNPDILRALAELARDDGQLDRAERSYRALLTVLRREGGVGPHAMVRTEVLLELADIATRQGQADRATEILESAFEIAEESELEAERLEASLLARGDARNALRALEAKIARSKDPAVVGQTWMTLAELFWKEGRTHEATTAWLKAVAFLPENPRAHEGARMAAAAEGRTDAYLEELERLIVGRAAEGPLALALSLRRARLLEADLKDERGAAEAYETVLARSPDERAALEALDRIYERLGEIEGQARVIAKQLDLDGTQDAAPLYRLAELQLQRRSMIDDACRTFERIQDAVGDDPEDEARLLDAVHDAAHRYPDHEGLVLYYERVNRVPGRERILIDALMKKWMLPGVGSAPAQEAILLAKDTLEDREAAEWLMRRFLEQPTDDPAVRAWVLIELAAYAEASADISEAVLLKREAAELSEGDQQRRLLFEIAALGKTRLGDLHLATDMYEQLHKLDPMDRDAWMPLLDAYRGLGESDKLASLIAEVQGLVEDDSERMRLRFERVRLRMDRIGDTDEVVAELREIVDDDAAQAEAAALLASIYERHGKDEDLVTLLTRQLDAAKDRGDTPAVTATSRRLGGLLEKRRRDEAKAIYYTALDWDPQHVEILRALAGLHAVGGAEEAQDRADVQERLLKLAPDSEAEMLALDLSVSFGDLGNVEGAVRALEHGFSRCPGSQTIRDRLEALYREAASHAKLAELFETEAGAKTDPAERVDLFLRAAALHQNELGDLDRAAAALRKARAADPGDQGTVDLLLAVLEGANDLSGAIDEIRAALSVLDEPSPRRALLLHRRALLRARIDLDDAALEDWDAAGSLGLVDHLPDLAAHLEKMAAGASAAGDAPRWRALCLRIADLAVARGELDLARDTLTELLRADSRDLAVLRQLAQIEEDTERWDAALPVYRRLVKLEEGEHAVAAALKLADMAERLGRPADARSGLERARAQSPGNIDLRNRLERIYIDIGAQKELAELYLADAQASADPNNRFAFLVRAASLLLELGGDVEPAIAALEEARALKPGDLDCVAILSDAYAQSGRVDQAMEVLATCTASFKGRRTRELSALYHRMARIAEAVDDKPQTLLHLTSALDMDAQNGVVASELAYLALELGAAEVATRSLRTITMMKVPAPMPKSHAYYHLAVLAREQGDAKKAVLLLRRSLDEDPSLPNARELLAELDPK